MVSIFVPFTLVKMCEKNTFACLRKAGTTVLDELGVTRAQYKSLIVIFNYQRLMRSYHVDNPVGST
jgi:hypothetical protein